VLSKFLFQKLGLDNGEGAAQILEAQDEQRFTNDGAQFTCFTGTEVHLRRKMSNASPTTVRSLLALLVQKYTY
jgi:hypothetical protein